MVVPMVPPPWPSASDQVEILVCQAGSCRMAGGRGVLMEIEELAITLGARVTGAGCLGNCDQAPNALIEITSDAGSRRGIMCPKLRSAVDSAAVVERATGVCLPLKDLAESGRMATARIARRAEELRRLQKWNHALGTLADLSIGLDQAGSGSNNDERIQLLFDQAVMLEQAGEPAVALPVIEALLQLVPGHPELLLRRGRLLASVGSADEALVVLRSLMYPARQDRMAVAYAQRALTEFALLPTINGGAGIVHPRRICGYARWTLARVQPISPHTALYHLESQDEERGTFERGRGRTRWAKTWHTTLLAMVGPNLEGPLPFVERDYTPVSSAAEWEAGICVLLVKVYAQGLGTQWIYRQPEGAEVWLSVPHTTLRIPSLVPEGGAIQAVSTAAIVVVGGTGVAPALQSMRALQSYEMSLHCIYSCCEDDTVLLAELQAAQAQLNNAKVTVCVTGQIAAGINNTTTNPFSVTMPELTVSATTVSTFRITRGRITEALLQAALLEQPSARIVVSGPAAFNDFVTRSLRGLGLSSNNMTVLEA